MRVLDNEPLIDRNMGKKKHKVRKPSVEENRDGKHKGGTKISASTKNATVVTSNDLKEKGVTTTKTALTKVKGLNNLGNTCFFNAVMQNLSRTPHFHNVLSKVSQEKSIVLNPSSLPVDDELGAENTLMSQVELSIGEPGALTSSLHKFLNDMNGNSKDSTVNPNSFFGQVCKKAPKFRGYKQQDSHELLRYLLDNVKTEEIKRVQGAILKHFKLPSNVNPKKVDAETKNKVKEYGRLVKGTFIDSLFGGVLLSTIKCDECHNLSTVFEPFLDLSLSVTEDKHSIPDTASPFKKQAEAPILPAPVKLSKKAQRNLKKQARREQKLAKNPSTASEEIEADPTEADGEDTNIINEDHGHSRPVLDINENTADNHVSGDSTDNTSSDAKPDTCDDVDSDVNHLLNQCKISSPVQSLENLHAYIQNTNDIITENDIDVTADTQTNCTKEFCSSACQAADFNEHNLSTADKGDIRKPFSNGEHGCCVLTKPSLSIQQTDFLQLDCCQANSDLQHDTMSQVCNSSDTSADSAMQSHDDKDVVGEYKETTTKGDTDNFTNGANLPNLDVNGFNEIMTIEETDKRSSATVLKNFNAEFKELITKEDTDSCLNESISPNLCKKCCSDCHGDSQINCDDSYLTCDSMSSGGRYLDLKKLNFRMIDEVVVDGLDNGLVAGTEYTKEKMKVCPSCTATKSEVNNELCKNNDISYHSIRDFKDEIQNLTCVNDNLQNGGIGEDLGTKIRNIHGTDIQESRCENILENNNTKLQDDLVSESVHFVRSVNNDSFQLDSGISREIGIDDDRCFTGSSDLDKYGLDYSEENDSGYKSSKSNSVEESSIKSSKINIGLIDDTVEQTVDVGKNNLIMCAKNESSCLNQEQIILTEFQESEGEIVQEGGPSDEIESSFENAATNSIPENCATGDSNNADVNLSDSDNFEDKTDSQFTSENSNDKLDSEVLQELRRNALNTLLPRYQPAQKECSILSCLNQFTSTELLTGLNKFGCDQCTRNSAKTEKEKRKTKFVYSNASKHYLIFSPPSVLTLHIKRFEQVGYTSRKVNRHVDFDFLLNLGPFCSSLSPVVRKGQNDVLYVLYGVVEHGGCLSSGHYTAYVKARSGDTPLSPNFLKMYTSMTDSYLTKIGDELNSPLCAVDRVSDLFKENNNDRIKDTNKKARSEMNNELTNSKAAVLPADAINAEVHNTGTVFNSGNNEKSNSIPDKDKIFNDKIKVILKTKDNNLETLNTNSENCDVPLASASHMTINDKSSANHIEIPSGRWYHISDNRVSEVTEANVKRAQAYLLFYERIV